MYGCSLESIARFSFQLHNRIIGNSLSGYVICDGIKQMETFEKPKDNPKEIWGLWDKSLRHVFCDTLPLWINKTFTSDRWAAATLSCYQFAFLPFQRNLLVPVCCHRQSQELRKWFSTQKFRQLNFQVFEFVSGWFNFLNFWTDTNVWINKA